MTQAALEHIKTLLAAQRFAVLCTSSAGRPYASLVAIVADHHLHQIYFATPKNTQKSANLLAD